MQHGLGGCVECLLTCFESLGLLGDHKTAFKSLSPRTCSLGCQQNLELTSTSALHLTHYSLSAFVHRLHVRYLSPLGMM